MEDEGGWWGVFCHDQLLDSFLRVDVDSSLDVTSLILVGISAVDNLVVGDSITEVAM